MIPLFYPYIPEEAITEVTKTLRSRWIGQAGKVDQFEDYFKWYFNVPYAVSVNSGSAALETAYDLLDLQKGDKVITTPMTCTATGIPLLRKGVDIIWTDVDENTLNLNLTDVNKKLHDNVKAVINVHLGGIESNLGKLPVPIISDAAQALGIFNGDMTCCSFQGIKSITCGDGGMLIVDNKEFAKKAKLMRWFGIDRDKKIANNWQCYKEREMTFDIDILGYKRHMNDIAATIGIEGLKKYDYVINYREELFNIYKNKLTGISGLKLVDGKNNVHWLCTVLVEKRDEFAKKLLEKGIETNLVHLRNDLYKIFGGKRADLPVLNSIENKYISIPLNMHITKEEVNYICDVIKEGWGV